MVAEQQVTTLLHRYSGSLVNFFHHTGTVSALTLAQLPAVQALFEALPVFAGRIGAVVHDGSLHVELTYNTNGPVCPYVGPAQTPLPTQRTGSLSLTRGCSQSRPGMLVRQIPNCIST